MGVCQLWLHFKITQWLIFVTPTGFLDHDQLLCYAYTKLDCSFFVYANLDDLLEAFLANKNLKHA